MNSCKIGIHQWVYAYEKKVRYCKNCKKRQEKNDAGKWIMSSDVRPQREDTTKYCTCPRDYTVSIRIQVCPHCGLPRRPR
jgi:hypothetical protein